MADVAHIGERLRQPLSEQPIPRTWLVVGAGLLLALALAFGLVVLARLDSINQSLKSRVGADDLARTRYETEVRALHDLKVKLDTMDAWYQEDVRTGLRKGK